MAALADAGAAAHANDRAYAARGLGLLGDPRGLDPVAKLYAAHRTDPYVVDLAPEALLRLDRGRALDLLLPAFREMEPSPRRALVIHLRRNPDRRIREHMTGLLDAGDVALRRDAVRALGPSGDAATAARLVPLLEGEVRSEAADALREIGAAPAARPIARALGPEEDPVVRASPRSRSRSSPRSPSSRTIPGRTGRSRGSGSGGRHMRARAPGGTGSDGRRPVFRLIVS